MTHNNNISVRMVRRDVADIFNVDVKRTYLTFLELKSIPEMCDPHAREQIYDTIRRDKSAGKFDRVCALLKRDGPDNTYLSVGRLLRNVVCQLSDYILLQL